MASKVEESVLTAPACESGTATIPPEMLRACAARHARLCPRQVLGLRIGLLAGRALGLPLPRTDKRLLAMVETDGCALDGISAATGCTPGHRTLKVIDFGKVAAVFIDVKTGEAIRIAPHPGIREAAVCLFPDARSRWHAQLEAYQIMPDLELLAIQKVGLRFSLDELAGQPGQRAICAGCGEEIINRRGIVADGEILCRACAGDSYYSNLDE